MRNFLLLFLTVLSTALFSSSSRETAVKQIAVFIPGVMAGSPIYEELDAGVRKAAAEEMISVKTIEGGFNSAEWADKLSEIAATGIYDLIVSSNPSIPQMAAEVNKQFPEQKFLIMDGKLDGHKNIYTAEFQDFDQAYMAGYLAGLVTLSDMDGANSDKKVGMIIAHHYPVLDEVLIPGYKAGLEAVDPEITVDLRVVGNWWDATKAAELTDIMINEGVDIFLPISGGANQGVISKCQDRGKYMIHFDSNGYAKAPGTVVGSTIKRQEALTYKLVKEFIQGDLPIGTAETYSAKDGYIDFIEDDPLYLESVPQEIRDEITKVVAEIKQ